MNPKISFLFIVALSPLILAAQPLPPELESQILTDYPQLDTDGNGSLSIREIKKGRKSLSEEDRIKVMQALAGQHENLQTQAAKNQLESMGLSGEQGIKYKESKQDRCYLDIVYPKNKVYEKAPLLIFIHGGGYHGGDRSLLYRADSFGIAELASERGIAVATLGYRLIGKEKEVRMVHLNQDIKDALRYLAQNSDRFGIDPNKFITYGQSAGGSLALIAALTPSDYLPGAVTGPGTEHTVIGSINFFGATTFVEPSVLSERELPPSRQTSWFAIEEGLDTEQSVMDCSPDKQLKPLSPPIIQISGEKDPKVPGAHGRHLNALAQKIGAPVSYYEIKNAGHGIKLANDADGELSMTQTEFEQTALDYILKWLTL